MYAVVSNDGEEAHRIYYKVYGNRDAKYKMIFNMGVGGDHVQWEPQIEYFSKLDDFQFIVYDNRGIGFSDPCSGRWTTKAMAKDALSLLDHLGWKEDVHIIGLSMGGMISQELALLDLKRFASITLISTISGGVYSLYLFALSIPTGIVMFLKSFLSSDPKTRLKNGLRVLFPQPYLEQKSINPETGVLEENFQICKRKLVSRARKSLANGAPPQSSLTIIKQAFAVSTHNVEHARMEKIGKYFETAALVITGDDDVLVHSHNSTRIKDSFGSSCKYIELKGAGHGAFDQCAKEINEAIMSNIIQGYNLAQQRKKLNGSRM